MTPPTSNGSPISSQIWRTSATAEPSPQMWTSLAGAPISARVQAQPLQPSRRGQQAAEGEAP